MKRWKSSFAATVALLAFQVAGCAVQPGDGTSPSVSSESADALGDGAHAKPEGLFGPASINGSYWPGNATFSGTNFSSGGKVFVGAYVWSGFYWKEVSNTVEVTATALSCVKTTCLKGGSISGTLNLTPSVCGTTVAIRAWDDNAGVWVTSPETKYYWC